MRAEKNAEKGGISGKILCFLRVEKKNLRNAEKKEGKREKREKKTKEKRRFLVRIANFF